MAEIEEALEPPVTYRLSSGNPAWYGDDDDAWQAWESQV
jgi:hypothetical protein